MRKLHCSLKMLVSIFFKVFFLFDIQCHKKYQKDYFNFTDLDETVIVENQQQQIQLLLDIALENKAMLKILTKQQDENKRKYFVENQLFKEISSMLPLKSITKLLEFEERLKEDERFSLAVVRYINHFTLL